MVNYLTNVLVFFSSYILGCLSFAFLFVKKLAGKNVLNEGSGNAGALNSYEITGKKYIGLLVFITDFLKGALAVFLAGWLGNHNIQTITLAAVAVVLGHNFNIFLKLKGGRGLSTAAGAFVIINPLIVVFWCLMFLAGYHMIKKQVHVAAVTGTIFAPLILYYTPFPLVRIFLFEKNYSQWSLILATCLTCLIILLKHIKPIYDLIKNKNEN